MDEVGLAAQLRREGFSRTYVWEDAPQACYPEHVHGVETAHVILSGQLTLTRAGRTHTYREGERVDVPAGEPHSARMGPEGCRYLIGER